MAKNPPAANASGASTGGAISFKDLLKSTAEEAVRPPVLPAGQFMARIVSHEFGKSRRKKTPQVEFLWQISAASEEIDDDLLEGVNVEGKKMREAFYLTPDAMWRLKEFFEVLVDNISGSSFEELIADSTGLQAWLDVSKEPSDDGEGFYNNIEGYAKV